MLSIVACNCYSNCNMLGAFFVAYMMALYNRDLTLGLEHGPKAIGEVWKAHFVQGLGCIQQKL